MSISIFFVFPIALYHISAQYFNDKNRFPCLISLLEMNNLIFSELRDQGGGVTSLFLKWACNQIKILLLEIILKTILKNSKCQICGLFFQLFILKKMCFLSNFDTF